MAKKDTGPFSAELLDSLLSGRDPKTILDSGGLIGDLKKALAERMLNAEMDVHLDGEAEAGLSNHRNGSSPKTVLTPEGKRGKRGQARLLHTSYKSNSVCPSTSSFVFRSARGLP